MSVILHASDLHFGKVDPAVVESFYAEIERQKPDVVVLSGDFTQTASKEEFKQAEEFINRISAPVVTVPGNHDIPRYELWERFGDPLKRYRKYINPLPDTIYEDDHCVIIGINTARPAVPHWNWANGMISQDQVNFVDRHFRPVPHEKARILVCHHPLVNVKNAPIDTVVWGAKDLISVLEEQYVDVVLTGHIHYASVLTDSEAAGLSMVGASSATSTRLRGQGNGYNILRVSARKVDVELIHWEGKTHIITESISLPRRLDFEASDQ